MILSKWRYVPALIWTGIVIYLLVSEPSALPKHKWLDFPQADKLIHAVLFFGEALALALFVRTPSRNVWIFVACVVLGGALEIVQYLWVEGRFGSVLDLAADLVGCILGLVVYERFIDSVKT